MGNKNEQPTTDKKQEITNKSDINVLNKKQTTKISQIIDTYI